MVPLSLGEGQDEGCFNVFPPHPSILLDGEWTNFIHYLAVGSA